LPDRIEAGEKAVDFARQAGDSRPAPQLEPAEALEPLGSCQFESAPFRQRDERTSALHAAGQSRAEAPRILAALQQAGTLPETGRSTLGDAVISLAAISAKLAETSVTNR